MVFLLVVSAAVTFDSVFCLREKQIVYALDALALTSFFSCFVSNDCLAQQNIGRAHGLFTEVCD